MKKGWWDDWKVVALGVSATLISSVLLTLDFAMCCPRDIWTLLMAIGQVGGVLLTLIWASRSALTFNAVGSATVITMLVWTGVLYTRVSKYTLSPLIILCAACPTSLLTWQLICWVLKRPKT